MKIFFGINASDKNEERMVGDELIIRRPSQESLDALNKSGDAATEMLKNASLPTWAKIIKFILGIAAAFTVLGIIRAEVSIEQAFKNAPYIFYIGGISLIGYLMLTVIEKLKQKKVLAEESVSEVNTDIDQKADIIYKELNVPEDAPEVDVLAVRYKEKYGEPDISFNALSAPTFINMILRAYVQDGMLCLADFEGVYAIPLSDIWWIKTVKKNICLPVWNKDEEPNKGIYKQYKITVNNYGYYFKPLHILEFMHEGVMWQLYFPCYELPVFERLTGHTAKDDDK